MSGTRKLKVTAQTALSTFKNSNGADTTLYEVFAVTEQDGPIELPLRAFETLPAGELIEVEVTPHDSERHGRTYTLKHKGSASGARLGPKVDDLRGRIEALEQRVEQLESRDNGMEAATPRVEPPW